MNKPENLKSIITGRSSIDDWMMRNYPDFKHYLDKIYSDIPTKEQLYLYYNNIQHIPTCPICGSKTKFHGNSYGYSKYCCSSCAQKDKETQEKIKSSCIERYGEEYNIIKSKKGQNTKEKRYGSKTYNNIEKAKATCIERYGVDNVMKSNIFLEKSKNTCMERYGVEYALLRQEYKNIKNKKEFDKMKSKNPDLITWDGSKMVCKCPDITCNKCQEKYYETTYYSYYERVNIYNICPCTKKIPPYANIKYSNTNIELFVMNILDEYNIKYIKNDRTILKGKEIDFYLPDYSLAIECNGVYWHSKKDERYHYNKFLECQKKNIQLITIWEDQIINNPNIITSIILSKLNIYKFKIYARKCIIKQVSSSDANKFISENHLQGYINSSVRLGLYYNNELVSIMTFGKKRKSLGNKNTNGWELYRYCSKLNNIIVGGASKLFYYFIKNWDVKNIESYSSNDISNGGLYKKLGFKYASESISYWYIKDKKRYHRYKFRKSELVKMGYDKSKTEFQIMDDLGYFRIYDTGQKKWVYNI